MSRVDRRPLRLRPGVIAAAIIVIARFVVPAIRPDAFVIGLIGAAAGAAAVAVWWVFFSRAPWVERIGAIAATVLAYFAIRPLLHPSIAGGMMGMMFPMYAIPPVLAPAFVVWAVATHGRADGLRRVTMVATIVLACGFWTLMRTDGVMGSTGSQLAWRWTRTAEERLLAEQRDEPKPVPAAAAATPPSASPRPSVADAPTPVAAASPVEPTALAPAIPMKPADWPGFRGADRDSVIRRVRIAMDWSASPPALLWKRAIGPGWSSFSVRGDRLYTQEQRGDDEVVSCYRVSTGEPIWRHRDRVRFWESNGGAGPRATPTLSDGRVYAFGATGILNVLDERTGAVLWSHNVASDTATKVPMWGFASSPLIVDGLAIVAASGKLVAYDASTGEKRWTVKSSGGSYSSPHLATLDGVEQVLLLSGGGAKSVAPDKGTVLWESPWNSSVTIVQPAVVGDRDVVITTAAATGGEGVRRLAVSHAGGTWRADERWTSNGLKPYFNDFVVHNGHAFGFDGNILSCIDLADGTRKWKGGRYGNGQLVLLREQDLLLVVSEEGDLALVKATPDQFTEVTRFPAALEGKTWNHPVVVRDVLLLRNDHEMAAFRLAPEGP